MASFLLAIRCVFLYALNREKTKRIQPIYIPPLFLSNLPPVKHTCPVFPGFFCLVQINKVRMLFTLENRKSLVFSTYGQISRILVFCYAVFCFYIVGQRMQALFIENICFLIFLLHMVTLYLIMNPQLKCLSEFI